MANQLKMQGVSYDEFLAGLSANRVMLDKAAAMYLYQSGFGRSLISLALALSFWALPALAVICWFFESVPIYVALLLVLAAALTIPLTRLVLFKMVWRELKGRGRESVAERRAVYDMLVEDDALRCDNWSRAI